MRQVRGSSDLKAWCQRQLERHAGYIGSNLQDLPEVRDCVITTVVED